MTIIKRAKKFRNRIAIIDAKGNFTYENLVGRSVEIASVLLANKIDLEEEPIAFMVNPSFNYTATQWGIWQAGGIAVPLCTSYPLEAIQHILEDIGAKTILVEKDFKVFLSPLVKKMGINTIDLEVIQNTEFQELPEIATSRRAMILYTSGTTNKPKGVVTTHSNIQFQIKCLVEAWKWTEKDQILNILPLHHVHGIINAMSCALWIGACCEFLPKFKEELVWEKFKEGKVNIFMAVPTIYFKLINYWDTIDKIDQKACSEALKKFRLMVSGSAALPITILNKWQEISSHILLERYGMTEIGMALSNPYQGERRPGHAGLPIEGVKVRLNSSDAKEGAEIQVKGPNVFLEYWNNPKATQNSFTQDGWFLTGDIAIINNGYFKILGRDSIDIIKSGGYKISALEIEEVILQNELIKECAVVGIPNEEWGELVVAFLVLKKNINLDIGQLKTWLKTKIPSYKIPKAFHTTNELPRNALGKVIKKDLKTTFAKN